MSQTCPRHVQTRVTTCRHVPDTCRHVLPRVTACRHVQTRIDTCKHVQTCVATCSLDTFSFHLVPKRGTRPRQTRHRQKTQYSVSDMSQTRTRVTTTRVDTRLDMCSHMQPLCCGAARRMHVQLTSCADTGHKTSVKTRIEA